MSRLVVAIIAVAVLLTAIIYSQLRQPPDFVSGLIEADEIRLGSRVGGRVKQVLVEEGAQVSAGDLLVDLDPFDLDEREQVALAELSRRDAELRKLTAGLRPEEIAQAKARYDQLQAQSDLIEAGPRPEEIAAAEHRLTAAIAQQKFAQLEFERVAKLILTSSAAKADYDVADEVLKTANANVEVRRIELAILQAGSREQERAKAKASAEEARLAWVLATKGFRTEEIEAATAAREMALAELDVIRRQKKELQIVAPTNGIVDALDLQTGDLVPPNAPMMTLLSTEHLWVRAYVPQRFLQIQLGQELRVTLDAWPGQTFLGTVTYISKQAEFTPGNVQTSDERAKQVYRIRVALPSEDSHFKPGMTANIWLRENDRPR